LLSKSRPYKNAKIISRSTAFLKNENLVAALGISIQFYCPEKSIQYRGKNFFTLAYGIKNSVNIEDYYTKNY